MNLNTQRGFTLLELLVVMFLLSVIMLTLVSALRTMAQTEIRIDQRLQRLDEIRVARTFLQQTLTRVSSALVDAPDISGRKIVTFSATPDSLSWIGILPARPNIGGRHYFRLALEDGASGQDLVLRFFPWNPNMVYPAWATSDARILITGIKQFKVQAQGLRPEGYTTADVWPSGWKNGWPLTDTLPEQVRISLSDIQGDWPEWAIPLRALPQSDGSYMTLSFGPGK